MSCLLKSKLYLLYIPLLSLLSLGSCEVINPEEDIPAYIHIQNIDLITDPGPEGSDAHKITDAWVYVDDELIGVFELPATFPVLKTGERTIKVRAGIKSNGISATRIQYPFYKVYSTTAYLQPGQTLTLTPVVKYFEATVFEWIENFDNTGTTIANGPYPSDTTVIQQNTDVFEGLQSGAVYLDGSKQLFFASSASSYNSLPKGEARVWLELNYKSTHSFKVGIMANNQVHESLIINPNENWNKIYVDLSPQVSAYSGPHKIFISMGRSTDSESAALLLDNIKLVH
jgi:hypothetical protein